MKFKLDKKYVKIGTHVIIFGVILLILLFTIINIQDVANFVGKILGTFFSLISPLIIGLILAYLLDPLVELLDKKLWSKRKKKSNRRLAATAISFTIIIALLIGMGYSISLSLKNGEGFKLSHNLIKGMEEFIDNFTNIPNKLKFKLYTSKTESQKDKIIDNIISITTSIVQKAGNEIIESIAKIGGYIINIFVGIIISFYLLMDKYTMLEWWNKFIYAIFPISFTKKLKNLWENTDFVISGYIRGQLIDALIMGTLISITLLILNIDYAVIIGIISGFSNLIPMVGATVATIIAILVALASDTPIKALYALITLLILQQIDGNIIVPKVVGKNVNLHPLLVMLSLFMFGSLFGILGMIVAVPITALIKHFVVQFINRRLEEKNI
ncbi:putative PurR-regulated permease PerM [Keratinibaculum paraultunense]|uniref:Putative PurR-regulated permease PerM n=1 Tax=Keratinibaculum paraultunense TaxID=1278232 RepID=A0A4V2UU70_9FIRM|nr:AI-2E family transporter [Keratinibaculum paraultunense]QQY79247.1 AI-2E family transporter [Keratinibaculum paraultunense]TCS89377.1 putative PurR-regulated permease PerM [Keratinibaculum paraultunense]